MLTVLATHSLSVFGATDEQLRGRVSGSWNLTVDFLAPKKVERSEKQLKKGL